MNTGEALYNLLEECDVCGCKHPTEACPELGLSTTSLTGGTKTRARLTLPDFLFDIDIGGEVGVFTRDSELSNKTQFGPFEAKKTTHEFSDDGVFILKVTTKDGTCISLDTTNENDCNWMCLIRAAQTAEEQNCIAYQMGMNVFYSTIKDIPPLTELRVWYAPAYARRIHKPETPDGSSKVMLGMQVIYPSVEHLPDTEQTQPPSTVEAQPQVAVNASAVTTDEDGTSSYTCKRCGDSFDSVSTLALHLRQHILPGYSPTSYKLPQINLKPKKRGRKPKKPLVLKLEKKKEVEIQEEVEIGEGDESVKDDGENDDGSDVEFTPIVIAGIKMEGRRIQPRRSLKGKRTSGFEADKNFVSVKIKTEKSDDGYGGPSSKVSVPSTETPVKSASENGAAGRCSVTGKRKDIEGMSSTPSHKKRKRGRPRKYKQFENEESTNKDEALVQMETILDKGDGKEFNQVQEDGKRVALLHTQKDERNEKQKITLSAEITERSPSPAMDKSNDESRQDGSGDHAVLSKNTQEINNGILQNKETSRDHEDSYMSTKSIIIGASYIVETTPQVEDISRVEPTSNLIESDKVHADDISSSVNLVSSTEVQSSTEGIHVPSVQSIENLAVDDDLQNILDELDKSDENGQRISPSLDEETIAPVKTKDLAEIETEESANKDTQTPADDEEEKADENDDVNPPDDEEKKSNENDDVNRSSQSEDDPDTEQSDPSGIPFHDYVKTTKLLNPEHEESDHEDNTGAKRKQKLLEGDYMKQMKVENTPEGKHYICRVCDKKFLQEKYFRLHYPAHTGKFKCDKCGVKFCRNDTLKRHKCAVINNGTESNMESKVGMYLCDICNQEFANEKYLFRHYAIHTNIFQCMRCNKSFSRKDSLQRHILKCCPEDAEEYSVFCCRKCKRTFATVLGRDNHETHCKQRMCQVCHSVFESEKILEAHSYTCQPESTAKKTVKYNCSYCKKAFSNLNYLKQHIQIHEGGYVCRLCERKLKTHEEKEEHEIFCRASSVIANSGKTACPLCGDFFNNIKLFKEHYIAHTHPHQCDKCRKRFIKVGSLHSHVCTTNRENDVLLSCNVCNKEFRSERMLLRHMDMHQEHKIQCQICDMKFHRRDLYLKHICKNSDGTVMDIPRNAAVKAQQEKLVCHICGKNFVSSSNLNKHMKVHGEKTYVCHICNKKFHYYEYLRVHLEGFHNKKYQYQCSVCGKILTSKPGLTSHVKQFHSDEKETHPCPTCGKVFSQKGNMKTHMYSHTKERGFHCPFCSKAFKYPDQLNRHKLIHTMQNKLQCDHCERKFTKLYDLKKHFELFHSGMMYVCDVCGARTGHRHTMVRHYKRKHPESADRAKEPSFLDSLFRHVDKEPVVSNEEIIEDQLPSDGMQVNNLISAEDLVPQSAAGVLRSLSHTGAVDQPIIVADGATVIQNPDGTISMPGQEGTFSIENIQQTVEGPDGQSTVVILQFVSPQDQENVEEEVQVQQLDTQVVTASTEQGEDVEAYIQSYVVSEGQIQTTV